MHQAINLVFDNRWICFEHSNLLNRISNQVLNTESFIRLHDLDNFGLNDKCSFFVDALLHRQLILSRLRVLFLPIFAGDETALDLRIVVS